MRKPGQSSSFYGVNLDKLAVLRNAIRDTDNDARSHLKSMFEFTQIYLRHAADLARSGQKDGARNWVRFFECSRVLNVFSDNGFEVRPLSVLLKQVSGLCHPADVPSWETDIQAIRASLEEILSHVKASENQPASSRCRGINRKTRVASVGGRKKKKMFACHYALVDVCETGGGRVHDPTAVG
jgi:hypothetical protein